MLRRLTTRRSRGGSSASRFAAGLALVALFFAGATLSAGAGRIVRGITDTGTTTCAGETTTEETTTTTTQPEPSEPVAGEPLPSECEDDPVAPGKPGAPTAPPEAPLSNAPGEPPASAAPLAPVAPPPASPSASPAPAASPSPPAAPPWGTKSPHPPAASATADTAALAPAAPAGPVAPSPAHEHGDGLGASGSELEHETEDGGIATVWLHRVLPDPTPPAVRLSRGFARRAWLISAEAHVDWALVLGVLRARGARGRVPAKLARVEALADRLAALNAEKRPRKAVFALAGERKKFAVRAIALWRYNRAVGLRALVSGLEAAKPRLERRVLRDERIEIYSGGRADVEAGRIDVRVLVLMRYLAEAHRQVTVSSLETGHRLYSRPGVISAHVYGLAVDIAGLRDKSIYGNQQPGGLTERAVRRILLLPAEVQPRQVISLLGLGGPSFPLADHADHIHVGY